jgi:IclR family KDG regulon transcriptional repressor
LSNKYWIPSIERVDKILKLISNSPKKYRLIDISNELSINKSSVYSILKTLESLQWIVKEKDGTFSLGIVLGMFGSQYSNQFNIVDLFNEEVSIILEEINETVQMSTLNLKDIVYIAKKENNSPVKLATSPGSTLPAHATAMGKVHLSQYSLEELKDLYQNNILFKQTPYTVETIEELWKQLQSIKKDGFIWEKQRVH